MSWCRCGLRCPPAARALRCSSHFAAAADGSATCCPTAGMQQPTQTRCFTRLGCLATPLPACAVQDPAEARQLLRSGVFTGWVAHLLRWLRQMWPVCGVDVSLVIAGVGCTSWLRCLTCSTISTAFRLCDASRPQVLLPCPPTVPLPPCPPTTPAMPPAPTLQSARQRAVPGRVRLKCCRHVQQPSLPCLLLQLRRLRDNVRSLGEYASERAGDESGRALVRGFFGALEAFDGALRQVWFGQTWFAQLGGAQQLV